KPDTNRPKKQTFNKKHFEQYHKTVTTIIRLLKKTGCCFIKATEGVLRGTYNGSYGKWIGFAGRLDRFCRWG
ncbi:hypothetical protein ACSLNR_29915, partial [Escherichia coli]|uniref:hypothetical protein n=1 Tax=Escherichia coli TaxID=562 RepID=UPI003EE23D64